MQNTCTFYLVRHGQTDWNSSHIIQGHTDIPLNIIGRDQAVVLQQKLRGITFDKAFSSDLLRAKETAEIITLQRNILLETTSLLRERNFGEMEGKPTSALHHSLEELMTLSRYKRLTYKPFVGYESDEELICRLMTFLREIALGYPNKTLLVVCHGGLIRSFLIHLGFATHEELGIGAIKNGAYIIVTSDGVEFVLQDTVGISKTRSIHPLLNK